MTHLKDFPWWPTVWVSERGPSHSSAEISTDGVLKNARPIGTSGLKLIVDDKGDVFTGIIQWPPTLSEDSLILLRHILLQHWGKPMSFVENIEIDFGGRFPGTK
jgi:hypothetical protein